MRNERCWGRHSRSGRFSILGHIGKLHRRRIERHLRGANGCHMEVQLVACPRRIHVLQSRPHRFHAPSSTDSGATMRISFRKQPMDRRAAAQRAKLNTCVSNSPAPQTTL